MAKIELICIGSQKFQSLKELEKEYEKKINYFSPFSATIIKPSKAGDEKRSMAIDGEKILERIRQDDILISLDRQGKEFSSEKFAQFIEDKLNYSRKGILFAIGGPPGLSGNVIKRSEIVISFSKMTFAHDLFKILFLEQLYRAFAIIKKTGYHRNS